MGKTRGKNLVTQPFNVQAEFRQKWSLVYCHYLISTYLMMPLVLLNLHVSLYKP
jgi:hypothetical protein